ncbi:MAG: methyl-accepting chemotaxis protein [Coleofasciculus sp. S288]|nr:methyl-accepting chemotaxis protein [Coleofasciculus sp. S288]
MMQELTLEQGKALQNKEKTRRPLKINQIVPLGFGAVLLLAGIATGVTEFAKSSLSQTRELTAQGFEVKELLKQIEKDLVDAETGERGYLFTGAERYLEPYEFGRKSLQEHTELLKTLIIEAEQRERLLKIEQTSQEKLAELDEAIALKKAGKEEETLALILSDKGKKIMDDLRVQLAEMGEAQDLIIEQRQQASDRVLLISSIINWSGWLVCLGAGVYISYYVARLIMQPIIDAASAVASSSAGIADTVDKQERTILEQTSSVNETTSTIEELGMFALQSAEQAENAAGGAKQALALAEGGTLTVGRTIEGITGLRDQVTAIANQIIRLSEQTGQISTVSELVADLANQTNMLALNAGVEAARAGEQGKGFAVVAGEIRKLADQSKKSADRINSLVNEVQAAINSTVMVTDEGTKKATLGIELAEEAGDVFAGIADSVNQVFLNTQQIAMNAKQQAVAVQQVVAAMNVINLGAKETATGIVQVKDATNNLNKAAQNLEAVV